MFCLLGMYPASVIAQTSITFGVLNVVQEAEQESLAALIKKSLSVFWPVLGLMLLYGLVVTAVTLLIQAVIFLMSILTLGIGTICAMPLTLLMYPAMYLGIVWMEQGMNGIVIDRLSVMDAIKQGWQLIRRNLLLIGLMAVVLYLGIGMVTAFVMLPMIVPVFIAPVLAMEHEINWVLISIALLSMAVFVPIFALVFGWSFVLTKSAWVLTYLRLTRAFHESQPVSQETPA